MHFEQNFLLLEIKVFSYHVLLFLYWQWLNDLILNDLICEFVGVMFDEEEVLGPGWSGVYVGLLFSRLFSALGR